MKAKVVITTEMDSSTKKIIVSYETSAEGKIIANGTAEIAPGENFNTHFELIQKKAHNKLSIFGNEFGS